jgi:hypothetical protein
MDFESKKKLFSGRLRGTLSFYGALPSREAIKTWLAGGACPTRP